jgi:nodulation protein E
MRFLRKRVEVARMSERRVVITGLGVICSLGHNLPDTWAALSEGVSGITPICCPDTSALSFHNGAQVRNFDGLKHFEKKKLHLLDRFAQFAVVAAREAVQDAGIDWTTRLKERTAVITGSCVGGQASEEELFVGLYRDGRTKAAALTIPRVMANAPCSAITMEFGVTGPSFTTATACSSANHAIGQALLMVKYGKADLAIAGGSEAPFVFGHLLAWDSLRAISPDTCRPFSKGRSGTILGEGAGMLVLEPLEVAVARGAHIYAELAGSGFSADANHLTAPTEDGPRRAIQLALEDAGICPKQVGYINAHGTGTAANDSAETRAILAAFGKHTDNLPVSSTKSMHGHSLGAAGAIEAVATTLSLARGLIPPTINFLQADPDCALDVVPNQARNASIDCALSNSFAFGGLNAVLAFKHWNG